MGAISNWTVSEADFPVNGRPGDKLRFAVKYAALAPPEHTWQPQEFNVSDDFVELNAKDDRIVDALDPERREAMISCGASLQFLKMALKHHGCFGRVELFPDLDRPTLAARIHAGYSWERDPQEAQLFEAMKLRGANHLSGGLPVPDLMLNALESGVARERGWLDFARSETSQRRLLGLTSPRGRIRIDELRFQNETPLRSTDGGWDSSSLANARLNGGFSRWRRPMLAVRVRTLPITTHGLDGDTEPVPKTGTYAVLKTKTDDKHGWLAAGQTMARLILHARTLGLSCSFFTDVLQRPALRSELRTAIGHKGFAQAILCFGAAQAETSVLSKVAHTTTATGNSMLLGVRAPEIK